MPVMDGYEFVRQLRLDPATALIPVVFYTAHYGEREARELALAGGVSDVLTKPAESAEVLKVVGRLIGGQPKTGVAPPSALTTEFDRAHLRLLTDKLSARDGDLKTANARLRALINIGLEFASDRDPERRLQGLCSSVRDLFGAEYSWIGILDRNDRTVQRFVSCGTAPPRWEKAGDAVAGILGSARERRAVRGGNPDVQAFLAAPIASRAHVYGWICLVGHEGKTFTEDDEQLVMALAGQVGGIYELDFEIIERRQAEAALRHERDRAQRYLDTAEVMLVAVDGEGRTTLVNRYACDLLGRSADELIGRDWFETVIPPRIRDAVREDFRRRLGGDLPIVEVPVLTRSGEERLIEWRSTLLHDDAGRVVGAFTSGTDTTERNRATEALRIAEERMRFALESAGVGIWDMDYTTGVLRWSEILEAQYGLRPGTFGGTLEAFVERIHPDDRAAAVETIRQATISGADFSVQHRSLWPDGTVRWVEGAGHIHVGERGEPLRGVGISRDVTERRTLEAQYHQAQKMEAIGRLAGGVAHDFNNLLTEILGYCELLLADVDTNDPRKADIEEIQKAGASAARLTRQLLAFSRKEILEPTVLDLNAVVAGMGTMVERLIGEDVGVVVNLRSACAAVTADRGQMEQVVLNLVVNARDAMPRGGTLTIETDDAELEGDYIKTHPSMTPGPYVRLTVSDTGTGMTPQVQARLFEPFFTTKDVGKGTGLGLATVHGIVTRSGGSVDVTSEIGNGTSFTVHFPRMATGQLTIDVPPPAARPRTRTETVLVVEDVEGLRELTRRLLKRLGYTVIVAVSAADAVELLERNSSIDVLLTDVVMPDTSGPELSRQLVALRPDLKVVYMSGYTEDTIVHHGVLNPGVAFLHKPFSSDGLGRKIREVLDDPVPARVPELRSAS